jgi:hypothetical protein
MKWLMIYLLKFPTSLRSRESNLNLTFPGIFIDTVKSSEQWLKKLIAVYRTKILA